MGALTHRTKKGPGPGAEREGLAVHGQDGGGAEVQPRRVVQEEVLPQAGAPGRRAQDRVPPQTDPGAGPRVRRKGGGCHPPLGCIRSSPSTSPCSKIAPDVQKFGGGLPACHLLTCPPTKPPHPLKVFSPFSATLEDLLQAPTSPAPASTSPAKLPTTHPTPFNPKVDANSVYAIACKQSPTNFLGGHYFFGNLIVTKNWGKSLPTPGVHFDFNLLKKSTRMKLRSNCSFCIFHCWLNPGGSGPKPVSE